VVDEPVPHHGLRKPVIANNMDTIKPKIMIIIIIICLADPGTGKAGDHHHRRLQ